MATEKKPATPCPDLPCPYLPFGDRVIVRRHAADGKTKSGLILPDGAKEKPHRGTVLAVGFTLATTAAPETAGRNVVSFQKIPLDVGDEVIFGAYAGTEIKEGDETYLVLSTAEVLAYRSQK